MLHAKLSLQQFRLLLFSHDIDRFDTFGTGKINQHFIECRSCGISDIAIRATFQDDVKLANCCEGINPACSCLLQILRVVKYYKMSCLGIKVPVLSPGTLNMERNLFVQKCLRNTFTKSNYCSRTFPSKSHAFILEHLRANPIIGIACTVSNLHKDLACLWLN